MGSEIEIPETPNWLKELEAKREKRLKTKLGHELGAGAPCLTCEDKCPGLDLHFWRKICKNCKCSKEYHEVQDDDIYGWAQDELLGTKVNRLKRKIVLPGRKDKEVELEWAPNGQKETIDKYLKSVPPELLPIKGSQAAQDRKQMLKKQIPVHDIDPTLCHELTEEELQKMQEYVAHIKQSSVGVGHLIQINFNKGQTHVIDRNDAMYLINNVPRGIVSSENVVLHGSNNTVPLKNLSNKTAYSDMNEKPFGICQLDPNNEGDTELNSDYKVTQNTFNDVINKKNITNMKRNILDPVGNRVVTEDIQVPQETCLRDLSYSCDDYPIPSHNIPKENNMSNHSGIKNFVPSAFVPIRQSEDIYNKNEPIHDLNMGSVRELRYPSQFINKKLKCDDKLPYYNPGNIHAVEQHQNPAYFQPIKDLAYPTNLNDNTLYAPDSSSDSNSQQVHYDAFKTSSPYKNSNIASPSQRQFDNVPQITNPSRGIGFKDERLQNIAKSDVVMPHFIPTKTVLYENEQSPAKIRNVKDLAYSTYESPTDSALSDDFHNLSVKDRLNKLKQRELSLLGPRNSPISERTLTPSKFSVTDKIMNLTPSFSNPPISGNSDESLPMAHMKSPQLQNKIPKDIVSQIPNLSDNLSHPKASYGTLINSPGNAHQLGPNSLNRISSNPNELSSLIPENRNIHEDDLEPSYIPIGVIKDIEYQNPDVRLALSRDNELFEGSTPNKFEPNLNLVNLPCCHYCKEAFKQEELAIAIPERCDAIYHTGCFKCNGCNQILADMFYFYDKSSNNIYCGRDYAKIRGIPRCMACDELIFVKEYCLAENSTFHVKHFCCFECDKPLADQNYVMEGNQPVCLPCYELTKANKCYACKEVIHPDQQGLQLKDGVHFHATDDCFACHVCNKTLFGAKLLFRNDCLYCSHDCYQSCV